MIDDVHCPYTPDELRRMQRTLRRRFQIGSRGNLIDVGFGLAQHRGVLSPDRGLSAAFFVRQKKATLAASEMLPSRVRLRLKRGRQFLQIELPTDVVEAAPLEPTGLRLETYYQRLTAGALLVWENPQKGDRSWGLATAGHALPPLESVPAADRQVTVELPGMMFPGTVIVRSSRAGRVDAAIVEVRRADLERAGLITSATATETIAPRSLAELATQFSHSGRCLTVDGPRAFRVHAYLPSLRAPGLGVVDHVISAIAAEQAVFQPGSSGAAWEIAGEPACMQLAGRAPTYQQGFGQAFETIVAWAEGRLIRQNLAAAETVRMAAIF